MTPGRSWLPEPPAQGPGRNRPARRGVGRWRRDGYPARYRRPVTEARSAGSARPGRARRRQGLPPTSLSPRERPVTVWPTWSCNSRAMRRRSSSCAEVHAAKQVQPLRLGLLAPGDVGHHPVQHGRPTRTAVQRPPGQPHPGWSVCVATDPELLVQIGPLFDTGLDRLRQHVAFGSRNGGGRLRPTQRRLIGATRWNAEERQAAGRACERVGLDRPAPHAQIGRLDSERTAFLAGTQRSGGPVGLVGAALR